MRKTGFKIDVRVLQAKLDAIGDKLQVEPFKPILLEFVRKSLNTAIKLTPKRELQLIRTAQSNQYNMRINYIPTNHRVTNPCLIVKGQEQWMFYNGKWFNCTKWKLPDNVWSIYQGLLAERERRMQTSRQAFIAERAQARYLYARSWTEVGSSIGLVCKANNFVWDSHTRRKPAKAPDKGYAQIRQTQRVITVVIYNPFIEEQTRYWTNDGAAILREAMAQHESNYKAQLLRQLQRAVYAIMHK